MQGLPQSRSELRVAPGRPYTDPRLHGLPSSYEAHQMPTQPIHAVPHGAPTMTHDRAHEPRHDARQQYAAASRGAPFYNPPTGEELRSASQELPVHSAEPGKYRNLHLVDPQQRRQHEHQHQQPHPQHHPSYQPSQPFAAASELNVAGQGPHTRSKRPDSAYPSSLRGSAVSGGPAREPPLSMPRVPSEPARLRINVADAAPLRIARSRPSPSPATQAPFTPGTPETPQMPPSATSLQFPQAPVAQPSPPTQIPPVPSGAREQIVAQSQPRAESLHRRGSSNPSDIVSVYDHYDEAGGPNGSQSQASSPSQSLYKPQSPTLPRSGPGQSGFLSRSVSAAKTTVPGPGPAVSASIAESSELSIEQFESARKHAASQPHDPRAQLELAKKLWEAADKLAYRYVDPLHPSTMEVDERVQARNRDAWTAQAIKIAKPLASKTRNPDAMFFLGSVYSTGGFGVEKDYVKALEYYQRAAQLDHTDSCYRIAVCEEFGVGTRRDFEKALSWYHKAAVLGSVASMYKLGMLSMLGSAEHKRDFRAGLAWLQSAADHADAQNPHALHELGLLYEHSPLGTYQTSDPLPRNDAKALEKFYLAAKLGYAPSQTRLGRAFEFGELGCNVDPNWSISWYTQAAKQRDSDAELALAGWYWTGSPGVLRKNETEAFLWAERAAGHSNARALFTVGYFYECGIGVPKDATRARRWYTRAAEKKHPRAADRLRAMVEASS